MRCVLLLLLLLCGRAGAAELPVWELGAALGAYHAPHYLGADQGATYALPLPIFIYRGQYLRSDRSGLVGDLYNHEQLDLRLSASASLPVSSEDNRARDGMPDLDFLFEVGPVLEYRFLEGDNWQLRADLPLRAAFSLGNDGLVYRGLVSNPRVYGRVLWADTWLMTATIGPVYASRRFHDYFYQVDSQYTTAVRPAYRADAGLVAMRYSLSLSRYFGDLYIGGFVHFYDLGQAANQDSPLVRRSEYLSSGLAIGWMLRRSTRMVQR